MHAQNSERSACRLVTPSDRTFGAIVFGIAQKAIEFKWTFAVGAPLMEHVLS
jgi:hypothetical protein